MVLATLIVAATLTLVQQRKHLPLQNVLAIGLLILLMAWAAEALLIGAGPPLQLYSWLKSGKSVAGVDLTIPLLWLVLVLNIRALVRGVLGKIQPKNIGLWVTGCTALCVSAMWWAIAPKPFSGEAAVNALARAATAALLLVAIFPWLVEKKPQSDGRVSTSVS